MFIYKVPFFTFGILSRHDRLLQPQQGGRFGIAQYYRTVGSMQYHTGVQVIQQFFVSQLTFFHLLINHLLFFYFLLQFVIEKCPFRQIIYKFLQHLNHQYKLRFFHHRHFIVERPIQFVINTYFGGIIQHFFSGHIFCSHLPYQPVGQMMPIYHYFDTCIPQTRTQTGSHLIVNGFG